MPERRFIAADRLFVAGHVVRGRGIWVDDGIISEVDTGSGNPTSGVSGTDGTAAHIYPGATLLPGLVDAHLHLCLRQDEDLQCGVEQTLIDRGVEQGNAVGEALLRAGVTAARDLGSRGDSGQRVRDGNLQGRFSLWAAGRPITSPGGHFASFGISVETADDARQAVDELVGDGADLIKVMATGGILTPRTAPGRAQFGLDIVRAVVARAHAHDRRVAAHAHGTEGIALSIEAGVDTIEHCSWLDPDGRSGSPDLALVERMAEAGLVVVIAAPMPQGVVVADGVPVADHGLMPEGVRMEALRRSWRNMAVLHQAGVRLALGTDSFFGQFSDMKDLAYRAEAMVRHAGWVPEQVIELMTEGGAASVGQAGVIGRLAPGARGDLVVIEGDPSTDIRALRRIVAVYRAGRRVV